MGEIQARLHADGSCESYDSWDDTSLAVWPTVGAWAVAWLAEWRAGTADSACEFAHSMTEDGTPWAIEALLGLVRATQGDAETLGWVGAGPLEDLISHSGHGLRLLDEIETTARREPLFARALAGVWLGLDVPDAVRQRLARFGARDFVAEHAMTRKELAAYFADRIARGWSEAE